MENIFSKLLEVKPYVWGIVGALILLFIFGVVITSKKDQKSHSVLTTKKIVYGGMCIAIAFILSCIKIFEMPQGGSITLASMFPIIIYAMIFGPAAGIVAGVAYGLLQLIQDAWVLNWAQFILDYPLAFGLLGLAGLAPKFIQNIQLRTCLAIFIAVIGRGLMHFLSGIIFFADSAPAGQNPVIYSLSYNGSYIIPEFLLTLGLSLILVSTPIYMTLKKSAVKTF